MTTSPTGNAKDESLPTQTEAYYEELASQEEIYLEEVEENLRKILTSKTNTAYREAGSFDEQLDRAAEELLTGDSDDPPLSEKTITEMLSRPLL